MIWLVLLVILLIIEAATQGLTMIWFAGGVLVAFFLSVFGKLTDLVSHSFF